MMSLPPRPSPLQLPVPLALLAVAGPLLGVPLAAQAEGVERSTLAMGTTLRIAIADADRETALAASELALRAVEAVEARLSTWRPDSELARLGAAPVGAAVSLSPELAADLAAGRRLRALTGGAFDPGIGALVELWGLRDGGRDELPSPTAVAAALARCGIEHVALDGSTACKTRPVTFDAGGFGKGRALDAACDAVLAAGPEAGIWLDFGGQLAWVLGEHTEVVAIADPRDRDRVVAELEVAGRGSLATSGNGERGILVAGRRRGHLLDPRTGAPAPDRGSLTVLAPDATTADALSTGLYVLGPERAFAVAATAGVEVVVLEPTGSRLRLTCSRGLRTRLRPAVPDLDVVAAPAELPQQRR